MASIKFNNVYIKDWSTISGPIESDSKLRKIDIKMKDYYFGEKTFEQAEIKMQRKVIDNLLEKNNITYKDIDLLVGGDLLNEISATNYAINNTNTSFLGIYNACATFPESLIIGSMFLTTRSIKNILTITSSHNLTAEKQFRFPIEYGTYKPHTSTFTVTGSVSTILSNEGKIRVESITIGKALEKGIKDANNLGAVMAPAAANTLYEHLTQLKRDVNYYDLILTGDLGCVGKDILREYCDINYNIKLKNHLDAGCEIYIYSEDVYAG